ncbi:hypothetical protein HAALTHF_11940n [Vreelandella aquamarina]|nr:hypothetical protein HAALTHF_11940n [Halomonas axialensis]
MNPCPCGHLGDPRQRCQCSASQIQRYQARLSGPLLDRIDLQVEVPALPPEQLTAQTQGEPSSAVRERVMAARERQMARARSTASSAVKRWKPPAPLMMKSAPGWQACWKSSSSPPAPTTACYAWR